ncbi:MAG: hypothetical protein A2V73_08435 [candidate division Zixibacteria bacterium RBG_19FT_COMBO_42_43]|nr:MAG: hypothetical protein A2V73_08435 [candidate division Zixibacteria bacterium RBG_19FT_COMBO_42_43]
MDFLGTPREKSYIFYLTIMSIFIIISGANYIKMHFYTEKGHIRSYIYSFLDHLTAFNGVYSKKFNRRI